MGILDHLVPKLFTELPLSNVKVLVTIHKKKKKVEVLISQEKNTQKRGKRVKVLQKPTTLSQDRVNQNENKTFCVGSWEM